jgi:hypothetical protein
MLSSCLAARFFRCPDPAPLRAGLHWRRDEDGRLGLLLADRLTPGAEGFSSPVRPVPRLRLEVFHVGWPAWALVSFSLGFKYLPCPAVRSINGGTRGHPGSSHLSRPSPRCDA